MKLALLIVLKGKLGAAPLVAASGALSLLGGVLAGEVLGALLHALLK